MIVTSDHDADDFPPLFRHNYITVHLITEQIKVMDDPGFQNECKYDMSVFTYFLFIKYFCD